MKKNYTEIFVKNWFIGKRNFLKTKKSNAQGKIDLWSQRTFQTHRSGWSYVLDSISHLHNSQGILFDGFLEDTFLWTWKKNIKENVIPFDRPWVGCLHNPQNIPQWFSFQTSSPQSLFAQLSFRESIHECRGLFAFSQYHAQYIRNETKLPVSVLYHPTEIPETIFDFQKFKKSEKKIITIGWWLRKLNAIYQLPLDARSGYKKIILSPYPQGTIPYESLYKLRQKERDILCLSFLDRYESNVSEYEYLSNSDYDSLLSQSIVFIELYDASANNAVIECIARHTPILVNPLPAVREYLGDEYPFYFTTLDEAAEKAMDFDLIERTTEYLRSPILRERISREYFLRSFLESEVYSLL